MNEFEHVEIDRSPYAENFTELSEVIKKVEEEPDDMIQEQQKKNPTT